MKLTLKEEMIYEETIAILDADFGHLEFYSRTGEIPKKVKEALIKAMNLKKEMVDTERQIEERENDSNEITQEQERIRSNMNTVDRNSQYYTRLLAKLNDQETQIEKLQKETDELRQTYEKQREDLEDYLTNLNVE
jgi:chromosome segregation ATPase